MTLMSVYAGNGDIAGRCDARCYDATEFECHCVCFGRNHGKGLSVATTLTVANSGRWIKAFARDSRLAIHEAEVFGESLRQSALF